MKKSEQPPQVQFFHIAVIVSGRPETYEVLAENEQAAVMEVLASRNFEPDGRISEIRIFMRGAMIVRSPEF